MSTPFIVLFIISTVISAVYLALPWLLSLRGIEMRRRSMFGTTLIFETPDEDGTPVRLLNVNGTFQSASYISDELWSELVVAYHREMVRIIDEAGDVRSVLVIGGGGFSLPKHLVTHTQRMRVTCVEIDPLMINIARERFFLDRAEKTAGERLEVVCADGWTWLRECGRQFDTIINEAFSGRRPLGPLTTEEGAQLIAEHLSPAGIYLADVRCPLEGPRSRTLTEVQEAFGAVFSRTSVIPERPETPTRPGNNVFVATNRPQHVATSKDLPKQHTAIENS